MPLRILARLHILTRILYTSKPEHAKSDVLETNNFSPRLCFLKEIEIEYGRIFSVLNAMYHYGHVSINTIFPPKEEALELYIECEDYERALNYAKKCDLSYEMIFISLTDACLKHRVGGQKHLPSFLTNPPNYLNEGDAEILRHQVITPSDKLWMILKKYLDKVDGPSRGYSNYIAVANHALKSQKISDLPFCIKDTLRNNCIDKLLQLYLNHNDAPSATRVLISEMKKVCMRLNV